MGGRHDPLLGDDGAAAVELKVVGQLLRWIAESDLRMDNHRLNVNIFLFQ